MPLYLFKSETGEQIEKFYSMTDAPKIGDTVEIDGVLCTRVPSFQLSEEINTVCNKYPYTSMKHGAFMAGAKHDKQGRAIIESRNHEKKFMAIHDLARD
jgi:hypothetical protein